MYPFVVSGLTAIVLLLTLSILLNYKSVCRSTLPMKTSMRKRKNQHLVRLLVDDLADSITLTPA